MITMAATIFLACENKLVGAFLFSIALYTICLFELNLFTGKVGYLNCSNKFNIFLILIANIMGSFIFSYIVAETNIELAEKAYKMYESKLNSSIVVVTLKSMCCGALMFLAVDSWKRHNKVLVFLCVTGFIMAGFEHSIANAAYLGFAYKYSNLQIRSAMCHLLVCVLGNSIGAILANKLFSTSSAK